tara:strand:+ start:2528 stop:3631 length:1104 start_codon:yes stop_codon:yes gene_type:complete
MLTKKTNLFRVLNNVYLKRNEPVSLVHFVTNRCNARCSFCFIDFDDPETFKSELSVQEIEKLVKSLGKSLLNVNLTGGEPFARKDLAEIVKLYIKYTTVQSIYITTNASLPDRVEKLARDINLFSPKTEMTFQISIDDYPDEHDRVRKIDNLFNSCLDTYNRLKKISKNITPVINVTVNHENCKNIKNFYNFLVKDCKIESIKCTIVRDEGVFKTPNEKKEEIFNAYSWLSNKITEDCEKGVIKNYNLKSLQGKLHNKKDKISYSLTKKMYLKPKYISPCHASGLFGIISAKGIVYPCEILENKMVGNLRDNDMNFMKVWNSEKNKEIKKFIKDTNCNCSYECALTYNILGNWRYQPSLLKAVFTNY